MQSDRDLILGLLKESSAQIRGLDVDHPTIAEITEDSSMNDVPGDPVNVLGQLLRRHFVVLHYLKFDELCRPDTKVKSVIDAFVNAER